MAVIRDPVLFSRRFGIDPTMLRRIGVLDPILNADTKLFIDPLLLRSSKHEIIHRNAVAAFDMHFSKIIKLLQHSSVPDDLSWRNAERLFDFREVAGTCIGYGNRTIRGSAIGRSLRQRLLRTAKQIVDLGIQDPELFSLLGLLEDGMGADRISDMSTNAILPALAEFSAGVAAKIDVQMEPFRLVQRDWPLPINPCEAKRTPVIFLPTDILRELPVVHDWSDIADAAGKNSDLRRRVNDRIGDIWSIRSRKNKVIAREAVLRSKSAFKALLDAVSIADKLPYDAEADLVGHYLWRQALTTISSDHPLDIAAPRGKTLAELERVAVTIVDHFVDLVEHKGLSYLLWHNDKPRHERAAQRLFFAVADAYCKANNLDVSPETDSGGGPVDFKFSSGYGARVLVETKLSTGNVVHGYETQLEVYKQAEGTARGIYLVVDVGRMGAKLERISGIRNQRIARGMPASRIYVADAALKAPASKR